MAGFCCHHLRQSNAAIFRCCWRPVDGVVVESPRWPGSSLQFHSIRNAPSCSAFMNVDLAITRDRQSCNNERTRHARHSRIHRPTPARVQGRRPIRYIQERHGCHLASITFFHVRSINRPAKARNVISTSTASMPFTRAFFFFFFFSESLFGRIHEITLSLTYHAFSAYSGNPRGVAVWRGES